MANLKFAPTQGEQNLTLNEAITAISMEFTNTIGEPTAYCQDCDTPFMDTFRNSTMENQAYVRNGYMQVCSCGKRGAYLTPNE